MDNQYQDPTRVGDIILAHRETLLDTTAAIASTTSMLREVLTELTTSPADAWPATWDAHRYDSVLALVEAAAGHLYGTLAAAVGEGDQNTPGDAADDQDTYSVTLTPDEAAALRARAAAHEVTPETEVLALVDAAIQRFRSVGGRS